MSLPYRTANTRAKVVLFVYSDGVRSGSWLANDKFQFSPCITLSFVVVCLFHLFPHFLTRSLIILCSISFVHIFTILLFTEFIFGTSCEYTRWPTQAAAAAATTATVHSVRLPARNCAVVVRFRTHN